MNLTRAALVASVATTVCWTVKAIAIGVAGGLGKSPIESPLFLLGLLSCLAATVLTGLGLAQRRTTPWRVLAAAGALLVVVALGTLASLVVSALQPAHPGWAWEEVDLWVVMLSLLVVNLVLSARRSTAARSAEAQVVAPAYGR